MKTLLAVMIILGSQLALASDGQTSQSGIRWVEAMIKDYGMCVRKVGPSQSGQDCHQSVQAICSIMDGAMGNERRVIVRYTCGLQVVMAQTNGQEVGQDVEAMIEEDQACHLMGNKNATISAEGKRVGDQEFALAQQALLKLQQEHGCN